MVWLDRESFNNLQHFHQNSIACTRLQERIKSLFWDAKIQCKTSLNYVLQYFAKLHFSSVSLTVKRAASPAVRHQTCRTGSTMLRTLKFVFWSCDWKIHQVPDQFTKDVHLLRQPGNIIIEWRLRQLRQHSLVLANNSTNRESEHDYVSALI
jgi:hypothetical protein